MTKEGNRAPHELKTWPTFFRAIANGSKTFEYRKNDRDFKEGDTLILQEWDQHIAEYTNRTLTFTVGWILHGPDFGIQPGYCVISLLPPTPPTPAGAGMETAIPTNYPWLERAHFMPTNSDTMLLAWVRGDHVTYRTGRFIGGKFIGTSRDEFRTQPNYFREVTGLFNLPDEGDKLRAELTSLRRQAEADRAENDRLRVELAAIGDLAVGNWDDPTVGRVDAINKEPTKYKDQLRVLFNAVKECASLRLQLASADKDRERMDWVDKNMPYILQSIDRNGRPYYSIMNPFNDGWRTLRAAIDNVMQPSASLDHGAREEKK